MKREKAVSFYPSWTDFRPRELLYGNVNGFMGIYRCAKSVYGVPINQVTHIWLDFEVSTPEEIERYVQYTKDAGYKGPTKLNVHPPLKLGEVE